ncbi:EF-hand domain-containing protein [Skermanella stibiiresistens]|nr:EF-hand domain-containing protein [Skermanella stibiiresistens]
MLVEYGKERWALRLTWSRVAAILLYFALTLLSVPIKSANAQKAGDAAPAVGEMGYERLAFEAADTNSDAVVSEGELARDAAVGFSSLDKDRSGTLTRSELGPHDPARFSLIDTNGDGVLTFSEVMRNKARAFAAGDKDGDGGLSLKEMVDAASADQGAVR